MKELAQIDIGVHYRLSPTEGIRDSYSGLGDLVSLLVSNAFVLAGLLLFFLMIGGGISMIAGAGQNNPESVAKGQKAVTAALVGFLIIFASYWIIQIIEYVTGLEILGSSL